MEPRHLRPYVERLLAATRALDHAVKSEDVELVMAAHEAVGRARANLAPRVGQVVEAGRRRNGHEREMVRSS